MNSRFFGRRKMTQFKRNHCVHRVFSHLIINQCTFDEMKKNTIYSNFERMISVDLFAIFSENTIDSFRISYWLIVDDYVVGLISVMVSICFFFFSHTSVIQYLLSRKWGLGSKRPYVSGHRQISIYFSVHSFVHWSSLMYLEQLFRVLYTNFSVLIPKKWDLNQIRNVSDWVICLLHMPF